MKPMPTDAVSTLFTIQRWNFLLRVETWVEAENVAYFAHVGFVLAVETDGFSDEMRFAFLARTLLKALHKHKLSDVSYRVKKALLTRRWKLPDDLCTVIGHHHTVLVNGLPHPTAALVSLADQLALAKGYNVTPHLRPICRACRGADETILFEKAQQERVEWLCRTLGITPPMFSIIQKEVSEFEKQFAVQM